MLTKWFGTCPPCHSETDRFVRPELEALEDRLPPSHIHGHGGHPGNEGKPPVHENVHIQENVHTQNNVHIRENAPTQNNVNIQNVHIQDNTHNNTSITITNSFNGSTFTNAFNGQNLGLMALPQSTMQGLFSTLFSQAAQINAAAANGLVADEAILAIDTFMTFGGTAGLTSNISSLQNAIASNPLETSSVGVLLGQVTFDVVLEGLVQSPLSSAV